MCNSYRVCRAFRGNFIFGGTEAWRHGQEIVGEGHNIGAKQRNKFESVSIF
jgi:hypothetical protein